MPWKIVKPGKFSWPGKQDVIIVGLVLLSALSIIIVLVLKN